MVMLWWPIQCQFLYACGYPFHISSGRRAEVHFDFVVFEFCLPGSSQGLFFSCRTFPRMPKLFSSPSLKVVTLLIALQ